MDIRYRKYHGLDNKTPWITYISLRLWHDSFHHLPYAPVKTVAKLNSLSSTLILQTKLVQVDVQMIILSYFNMHFDKSYMTTPCHSTHQGCNHSIQGCTNYATMCLEKNQHAFMYIHVCILIYTNAKKKSTL